MPTLRSSTPSPATIGIAGTTTRLTYRQFPPKRPIDGFDRILALSSDANSIYHGMVLQLRKRFSHNYQFMAGYTFGKAIDDNPDSSPLNPGPGDSKLLSDSFTPSLDRGASDGDQRHRLVLMGIWHLQYADHLPTPARTILQGWEFSGILTAQSGQPYSAKLNFDLNNDGNATNDRTPGVGRNTYYTPATFSLDPRLTRNVRLTERTRLQFIWEAFNVFNRANISGVRSNQFALSTRQNAAQCAPAPVPCLIPQNQGASAFGTPRETLDPRIMQFSLKLLF